MISMYRVDGCHGSRCCTGRDDAGRRQHGSCVDAVDAASGELQVRSGRCAHRFSGCCTSYHCSRTAAATAAAEKAKAEADAAKAADTSVSMPAVGQIYISEIMVAGGGTLPQWIEISNGSRTEQVNLSGWTLTVDNAAADADVSVGASIKFTIPEGTKIDPSGQNDTPSTILVVTEAGRNNVDGTSDQVLNLWTANQTELILSGVTKRRYSLLSDMAFQITLAPPAVKKTNAAAGLAATATPAQKAAAQAADAKVADTNQRRIPWVTSVPMVLLHGHCR